MRFRSATALVVTIPLALGLATAGEAQAFSASSPTGVDVSKWQHPGAVKLDWDKVAASGEKFAFIKATDGVEGESGYFMQDSTAAAKAGLIIGSYHKAHPDRSATKQADEYAAALAKLPADAAKLPPVLDIELENGLNTKQLQDWTETFLTRLEEKTGQTPMIYTFRWFWESPMGNTDKFKNYPLWLAAYQSTPPTDIPGGWDKLTFWQRSSTGKVPGIPTIVDQNTFNGSAAELNQLVSGTPVRSSGTTESTAAAATTAATTAAKSASATSTGISSSESSQASTESTQSAQSAESTDPSESAAEPTDSSISSVSPSLDSLLADATAAENSEEGALAASPELMDLLQQWLDGGINDKKFANGAQQEGVTADDTDLMVALLDQVKQLGKSVDKQQLQQMDAAVAKDAKATGTETTGTEAAGTESTSAEAAKTGSEQAKPSVTISDIIALIAEATR